MDSASSSRASSSKIWRGWLLLGSTCASRSMRMPLPTSSRRAGVSDRPETASVWPAAAPAGSTAFVRPSAADTASEAVTVPAFPDAPAASFAAAFPVIYAAAALSAASAVSIVFRNPVSCADSVVSTLFPASECSSFPCCRACGIRASSPLPRPPCLFLAIDFPCRHSLLLLSSGAFLKNLGNILFKKCSGKEQLSV